MIDDVEEPRIDIGAKFILRDVTVCMFATATSELTIMVVPKLVCREGRTEMFQDGDHSTLEYRLDFSTPGNLPDQMMSTEHLVTIRGTHSTGRLVLLSGAAFPWFDEAAHLVDGVFDAPPSFTPVRKPPRPKRAAPVRLMRRPTLKLV